MESARGHCIFTIEGAERQDEGMYSVIVRNPAGEDTADITVKVVGTFREISHMVNYTQNNGSGLLVGKLQVRKMIYVSSTGV